MVDPSVQISSYELCFLCNGDPYLRKTFLYLEWSVTLDKYFGNSEKGKQNYKRRENFFVEFCGTFDQH